MTPLAALLVAAPLAFSPSLDDDLPRWVGTWVSQDGAEALLLEPSRCGWRRGDDISFYRLHGDGPNVDLESWGRVRSVELRVDRDLLTVTSDGTTRELVRTSIVPPDLRLDPYALPEATPLEPETVERLRVEFAHLGEEDQRVRRRVQAEGFTEELGREMREVDEALTARLLTVMSEFGWIDATRFGRETSSVAFLIVQHSGDLRLMRTALPYIEKDVRAGRLDGQNYALLYDRLQLNLGHRQRYGSQLATLEDGESVLMPLEDPEGVDERRAEMGMGPLAGYLAWFADEGEEVRTLEAALRRDPSDD